MSIAISTATDQALQQQPAAKKSAPAADISAALSAVQKAIAPVWPLRDYVAVNPYGGFSSQPFLAARQYLRSISDCETLMPLDYYRGRFQAGHFGLAELETAIDEMVEDQIPGAESLCANSIYQLLGGSSDVPDDEHLPGQQPPDSLQPISRCWDRISGTDWTATIHEELSKHCAAHYDEGQARWSNPWKNLPLYQAWRSAAVHDRTIEILGLDGFRDFVSQLPDTVEAALVRLLQQANIPREMWQEFLLCLALDLPGWSAWTKFKTVEAEKAGVAQPDFAALLAMRLAYDVALARHCDFSLDFESLGDVCRSGLVDAAPDHAALLGFTLLRANEIAFREGLLERLQHRLPELAAPASPATDRRLARMVFCIDVRSERIRRNLEATSEEIETCGFAGFFGLPFQYVRLGDTKGTNQLPVLVEPQFKVYEEIRGGDSEGATARRTMLRTLRKACKALQTSAVSCFAFVETTGLFYGGKLLGRTVGTATADPHQDGVPQGERKLLGPGFRNWEQQGLSVSRQADLGQAILTNLGMLEDFPRLVVFCGHASHTENNPLQAGLDCGACAGHSGEANARLAARLLNQPRIRQELHQRGLEIPEDVHFLGALHNTTTDVVEFFDLDLVPSSRQQDLAELTRQVVLAGQQTRRERLQYLPGKNEASLFRRSTDWSEVRPEWGLTGNAAFIVGPRRLTKGLDLQGKSFLHSYDFHQDAEGKILEQIMTAPLVVANWINMQYYASTVDPRHFGSGNKTIHNVVGKFGIFSGGGGDLQTGLPWQSLHDGQTYQHDPQRLLCVIAAPREAIDRVLAQHAHVRDLVVNGWIQLLAVEESQCHRYSSLQRWEPLACEM